MNEIKRPGKKDRKSITMNPGTGDYTKDRHKIHKGKTVKNIIQEIKESRKK